MLNARMLNSDFVLSLHNGKVLLNGAFVSQEEIKGFIRAYDRWGRKDPNRVYTLSSKTEVGNNQEMDVFILSHACARSIYVGLQVLSKIEIYECSEPNEVLSQADSPRGFIQKGSGESNG